MIYSSYRKTDLTESSIHSRLSNHEGMVSQRIKNSVRSTSTEPQRILKILMRSSQSLLLRREEGSRRSRCSRQLRCLVSGKLHVATSCALFSLVMSQKVEAQVFKVWTNQRTTLHVAQASAQQDLIRQQTRTKLYQVAWKGYRLCKTCGNGRNHVAC